MDGFTGWHAMIILGVLLVGGVSVALAGLGVYWLARVGARRGIRDERRRELDTSET